MQKEKVTGYHFDEEGNLVAEVPKSNAPIIPIKGAEYKKEEDFTREPLGEEERNDRVKQISLYAKKYPHLTIEQIGELMDSPDLGLGEDFVINKIVKKYR